MEVDDDYSVENDPIYHPELMMIDSQGDSSVSDRPFDGFGDLPMSDTKLMHFNYEYHVPGYRNRALVYRYAELGIHRYNLLEGTDWELFSLKSFNKGMNPCAAPYFLIMEAFDPVSWQLQPFQALVCEKALGVLDISVDIARPRGLEEPPPLCEQGCELSLPLPPWPSSEMITDTQHFYMLEEHELRNTPWVRLYLDLVHCTSSRGVSESQLSDFHILQVTIGSLYVAEPARINSTNAVVYIVYRDLVKFRGGKPSELRAIIRRVYDESTRSLSIQGKHWNPSEKKKKKRFALLKKRLGVWGAWRLRLDVYRKRTRTR
ncbi:UPF0725 protein EMB2204 [Raphanus sativus]|uniref:UPF0725 protein EMB2204-like isoform X1 n=2 Tax=Raphanus sativus TaxID=3726 RepID=A0A6J0K6W0_RAPSA|nr:UPF0725 protein EMB2204-like isoform X1 [Raphanus sativus]XP_056860340.1 UPF0725 protein EMB2204-like isoform X1 [Raphanus sativus]KAJ4914965.1 UPF0725 protein EMB2204 [Raphanus sativus]